MCDVSVPSVSTYHLDTEEKYKEAVIENVSVPSVSTYHLDFKLLNFAWSYQKSLSAFCEHIPLGPRRFMLHTDSINVSVPSVSTYHLDL